MGGEMFEGGMVGRGRRASYYGGWAMSSCCRVLGD